MAMDAEGAVAWQHWDQFAGKMGFSFGHRSDAGAYLEPLKLLQKASLIVVEWGFDIGLWVDSEQRGRAVGISRGA